MYESPIHIYEDLYRKINADIEQQIMVQVNAVVDVDKEELTKALNYDRDQYYKGYEGGFNNAEKVYKRALELACETIAFGAPKSDGAQYYVELYIKKAREE